MIPCGGCSRGDRHPEFRRFRSGICDPYADVPGYLYDWRSAELAGEEDQEIGRHSAEWIIVGVLPN